MDCARAGVGERQIDGFLMNTGKNFPVHGAASGFVGFGHDGGDISMYDPKTGVYLKKLVHKGDRKSRITCVNFSGDDKVFLAGDEFGHVHLFSRLDSLLPIKEDLVVADAGGKVRKTFMCTALSTYFVFLLENSVNIFDLTTQEFTDIASCPVGEKIFFDAKLQADGSMMLVIWYGCHMVIYEIAGYDSMETIIEMDFEAAIKECIIRKNFVTTVVMKRGDIYLVVGSKNPTIEHYDSKELRELVTHYVNWVKSHETLFFFTYRRMSSVVFIQWDERIKYMAETEQWEHCFQLATGIYTGTNLQVFGVTPNPAQRCIDVQNLMAQILPEAMLAKPDDLDHYASIVQIAADLEMTQFVIEQAYKFFEDRNSLGAYFDIIFNRMRKSITNIIPESFYGKMFKIYREMDKLEEAEKMVLKNGIPQHCAGTLLRLARKYDMQDLMLLLWTRYFNDYISPVVYLYKTEDLVKYMSGLFIEKNLVATDSQKRAVVLWFFTSFGGTFPRIVSLFSKDWTLAPKFLEEFLKLLPVKLRNGINFTVIDFVDAVVRTVTPISFENVVPVLDVVCVPLANEKMQIPCASLEMLVHWAFQTTSCSVDTRESVVILIHEQYPEVIVYQDVLPYCEKAGFSRIVNEIYLPVQNYNRVIETMAVDKTRRKFIFRYISNPYLDPLRPVEEEVKENGKKDEEEEQNEKSPRNQEPEPTEEESPKQPASKVIGSFKKIGLEATNASSKLRASGILGSIFKKPAEETQPEKEEEVEYEYEYVEEEEEDKPEPPPKKRKRHHDVSASDSDHEFDKEEEEEEEEQLDRSESAEQKAEQDNKEQAPETPPLKKPLVSAAKSLPDLASKFQAKEQPQQGGVLRRSNTGFLATPKKKMKTVRKRIGRKRPPAETYTIKGDPKMQDAIRNNLVLLVLIDADESAKMIGKDYPEYHRIFVTRGAQPFVKFKYLKAMANSKYNQVMSDDDYFELFKLTCQFAPPEVLPMLKTSHTIQIDEALPVCLQYRVIDACIHIDTMLGDMQAAVDLVAEELEAVLVDAINSKKKMKVISLDLVKEEEALRKAYDTVLITFDLLSKAPEIGSLLEKMWKNIFLAFQLPLWRSNQIEDQDTRRSITLFFAFFVVEALARTKPETVFEILKRDFCIINQLQYRDVLAAVFKYLDYNEMLAQTVIHLLLEDCILLYQRATLTRTRAAFVYNTNCVICNTPITGAGGVGALVFECGHSYHDNQSCGGHRKSCPLCKRELTAGGNQQGVVAESSRAKNMRMRALNRVEFGLRRHYGKDQDLSECGSNIFFFPDPPVEVKGNMQLRVPNEEDFIEQAILFLEL